jgi:hypothetical protein
MTEWEPFDSKINATVLYDDEPTDQVYYQALAAGEIHLDANTLAPKTQKRAHSGADREWTGLWTVEERRVQGRGLHRPTVTPLTVGVQGKVEWTA